MRWSASPRSGLIAHEDTAETARAGGVYMAFTILGEALLLMAFALLAAGEPHHSLAYPRRHVSPARIALARRCGGASQIAGFGMKMALVPMHGWMPLA